MQRQTLYDDEVKISKGYNSHKHVTITLPKICVTGSDQTEGRKGKFKEIFGDFRITL